MGTVVVIAGAAGTCGRGQGRVEPLIDTAIVAVAANNGVVGGVVAVDAGILHLKLLLLLILGHVIACLQNGQIRMN